MKRILTILAAVALAAVALAKPVDAARARRLVEERFFAPAQLVSPAEWSEIYVFAPAGGNAFVVVSADDCTRPVLAYSYSQPFRFDAMPPNVASWIEGYRREVASLREAGATASPEVARMWVAAGAKDGADSLPPMVTTTWNQRPLYNILCPYSEEDSALAVAGCVATAQAQLMKYWEHPAQGHGSFGYYHEQFGYLYADFDTTYMWDQMPAALTSLSSDEEIYAVAQLTYHAGVSVGMNYGVSSSGAPVFDYGYPDYHSTEMALKRYFGYSPMMYQVQKSSYNDAEWDSIMLNELRHGRPVIYSGFDYAGGHAFIVDGYSADSDSNTGNRFFHINWGWGGHNDGYYTLDSLSPGSGGAGGNATYTFNMRNAALVGVEPISPSQDGTAVIEMYAEPQDGSIEGNGTYELYDGQVTVIARANPDRRFVGWKGGSEQNPITFTPSGNLKDTALFAGIGGDTMGYCGNQLYQSWRDDYGYTTEWGIRLLPEVRHCSRALFAVQVFQYITTSSYDYVLNIFTGSAIDDSEPIYSKELVAEEQGWRTIVLDSALRLGDGDTLWITFSQTSEEPNYPATHSRYSGNSDGSWYRLPEGWRQYDSYDQGEVYATWMIRGIFEERPVTVAVDPHMSEEDLQQGGISITGAGVYNVGETVTITVDPGISFSWNWGEEYNAAGDHTNPLVFVAERDTTLSLWFADCTGIDGREAEPVAILVLGREVIVQGGEEVTTYDATGRLVATGHRFRLPAAGVYLVCIDGTFKKIVTK